MRRLWPWALLCALVLGAFSPVGSFEFLCYDDTVAVTENAVVLRGLTAAGVRWAFVTRLDGNWMPLTWLSHMLAVSLFGTAPGAHHLVNLALHLAATLLLFAALANATGRRGPSLFAAAVFGVHPLHVESVAWVAERKDVLMAALAALALLLWLRWVRRGSRAAYAGALALFTAALAAKALVVTLPLLMLLLDAWPLGRLGGAGAPRDRRALRETLPFLAIAAALGAVAYRAQQASGAMRLEEVAGPARRAAHAAVAYLWYLGRALVPADLGPFYPYPAEGHRAWVVAACALALAALTAAALAAARRAPALAVGWGWFLLALAPVAGFVQVGEQAWADRYTYLALTGLALAAGWGLPALLPAGRARALLAPAAVAATLVLAVACRAQVGAWRDAGTLFTRSLAVTGETALAHTDLGIWQLGRGRLEEAGNHFRSAIRLRPDAPQGYHNLGNLLLRQGRAEEAAAAYAEAARRDPGSPRPLRGLGGALARLGRHGEAVEVLAEADRREPDDAGTLALLGVSLSRVGRVGEAVTALERAARLDPANRRIRSDLEIVRALARRPPP
jgi:Flp pilus assembly protein TadD